jgi:pimeloyl-ACP methyl ester carboxylesterase
VAHPSELVETVAGCRTRLLRGGEGPPLLFLHGAGGVPAWLPFMRRLAERFDVIVPDHPGFGRSDMPDWLDTMGDLAYFYLDFMAQLRLSGVHLIGASLGGWIAMELAVRNTTALSTVMLIAPCGIHLPEAPLEDVFLWNAEQNVRNLYADQRLADMLLSMRANEAEQQRQARNARTAEKIARQPLLHNPHLHKWLHRIDRPTLLLWGDSDKVVPPAYGPAFRDLIPGARLEVVPACGHVPHIEKPDLTATLISEFVARQRQSDG